MATKRIDLEKPQPAESWAKLNQEPAKEVLVNLPLKDKFRSFILKMLQHIRKNHQQIATRKIQAAKQACLPQDYTIGQNEIDAFRMKAIVLLKKDSILGTPLNNLLKGPIEIEKTDEENKKIVFHLSQRFEWSGNTYQLEGKFLKDQSKTRSISITDSFKLTLYTHSDEP